MPSHLKVRCPACEKSLNVSLQHQGKQVKCPTCSAVFKVGTIPAAPTQPLAPQPLAPQAIDPIMTKPPVMSDQRPAESSYTPQRGMPTGTQFGSPRKRSRRELLESGKQKQKSDSGELSEADEKIQSAGFFLISLPVIATLLPLFGLQLKRLASSGEFAPIAAGFLGMIGAGCIGYARRSKGDGLVYGGSAAAFVAVASITGFMILISMAPDDGSDIRQARGNEPGRFQQKTSRPKVRVKTEAEMAADRVKREQRAAEAERLVESVAAAVKEGQRTAEEDFRQTKERLRQAEEDHDKKMAGMKDDFDKTIASVASRFGRDKTNPNITFPNNPKNADDTANPFDAASSKAESSKAAPGPVFKESIPNGLSSGRQRTEIHRRWGFGGITFAKIRISQKLEFGLKFAPTKGEEQRSGKLFFFKRPIVGLEVIKIGATEFVPLTLDDAPSDLAIVNDENQLLTGFNLALDDQQAIVGIQGIFISSDPQQSDSEEPATSHWLGMQTDNIQKTVVKKGNSVHGFACFTKGFTTTGFALVYKKSRSQKTP